MMILIKMMKINMKGTTRTCEVLPWKEVYTELVNCFIKCCLMPVQTMTCIDSLEQLDWLW